MRIAQIAPLAEAVPPKFYGGTERVVSWLTEALVELGHDVTLFASADSTTSARLEPCAPTGLRLAGIGDHTASTLAMLDRVLRRAHLFDIIHFHVDMLQFPMFRHLADKCLTTLHGRQDLPDFLPVFGAFPEMKLVSISDNQKLPIADANFVGTVHHGLPPELIALRDEPGDYLAFIGRISPEKRPDRAIEIAVRSGMKLRIAAKVDKVDREFQEKIEPLMAHPLVESLGEIGDDRKAEFLGRAAALLFPIDWPEPFGLVMVEAMAAGTPVIAWPNGSAPEVIEPGRSGFLVDNIEDAVSAAKAAANLSRWGVRAAFEARFTAARMARDYEEIYRDMMNAPTPIETAGQVLAAA